MTDRVLPPAHHRKLVHWFEHGIPFNAYLGLKVDRLERGLVVLRLPFQDHLIGDIGRPALHGGVTSMLADTAGGAACFAMLDNERDRLSTVDLRVDFLRPGVAADVVCRAEVLRMGNHVGVTSMKLWSGGLPGEGALDPLPFATGQAVYNILRRS
ncbi:MAG: hotdog fold thioesterase [Nannocystaceae bacterium]|nr:hotdog fold thioesterase [Nannocystaceae bacterium]